MRVILIAKGDVSTSTTRDQLMEVKKLTKGLTLAIHDKSKHAKETINFLFRRRIKCLACSAMQFTARSGVYSEHTIASINTIFNDLNRKNGNRPPSLHDILNHPLADIFRDCGKQLTEIIRELIEGEEATEVLIVGDSVTMAILLYLQEGPELIISPFYTQPWEEGVGTVTHHHF